MVNRRIYSFKPSVLAILLHFKIFLLAGLIPFFIMYGRTSEGTAIGVGAVMGLVFGGRAAHYGLDMCFSRCDLYTTHLEYRTGWVKIARRVLKYENVVDVSYAQNVHDRILQFGRILVTTKGMERKLEMKYIGAPYKRYKIIKQILTLSRRNPKLLEKFAAEKGPINVVRGFSEAAS